MCVISWEKWQKYLDYDCFYVKMDLTQELSKEKIMIKIIADSTAYMTKEYAKEHNVSVVPLRYLYKDKEFVEGWPGEFDEFFDDFTKTKIFPKTSQPSLELFTEEYNKAIANGDEVLVITLGSNVSGSFSVANLAKSQCDNPEKVFVFDSQALAQTIFGYIMEAVDMRDAGLGMQEILAKLESYVPRSSITFIPDTLEYIAKGGRIGKVTATLGSILQIKPIVTFNQNILSDRKCFGLQKAIREMIASIPQKIKRLFILHIANSKLYEAFKKQVWDVLNKMTNRNFEVYEGEVGPVIATHAGPAIGLAWIAE